MNDNDDVTRKGRFSEIVCVNPLRSKFSSRCTKSQHGNCSGKVLKSRSEDGLCPCECHEIKHHLALIVSSYGNNDFILKL